jgi:prepilin-type N-terminal cleavage/methylation domain-containing protein
LRDNSGFTLVELLVTLGLITVITFMSSDFLLNLVSASVRIQNKATLEQNYSYISSKLIKMIEEADSVTVTNGKINISLDGTNYIVELKDGQLEMNNLEISSASNLKISSDEAFSYFRSSNPVQIVIKLNFEVDAGSTIGASQEFERIVTVRKSYNN